MLIIGLLGGLLGAFILLTAAGVSFTNTTDTGAKTAKTVYTNKAEDALKSMRKWLRDQQTTAFNVTYRGKTRTLGEWAKGFSVRERAGIKGDETVNFREYINASAGFLLAPWYAQRQERKNKQKRRKTSA